MNIHTKDGLLSAYGFSCGYMETRETDQLSLNFWYEGGVYHITLMNYQLPADDTIERRTWVSFDTLQEAIAEFFRLCDKWNFRRIKRVASW